MSGGTAVVYVGYGNGLPPAAFVVDVGVATFGDMRGHIRDRWGIHSAYYRLLFASVEYADSAPLSSAGVVAGSELKMVFAGPGRSRSKRSG